MSLISTIEDCFTDEVKTFIRSMFFDKRIEQDITVQHYSEPVGMSYILNLYQNNSTAIKKLLFSRDRNLGEKIENESEPFIILNYWIDSLG